MQNQSQYVFPVYLVIDVSGGDESSLVNFANQLVANLLRTVAGDPIVDQLVRLSLIEMGDKPVTLMQLARATNSAQIPGFLSKDSLSLSSVFAHLKAQITTDMVQLQSESVTVYRPTVFFFLGHSPDEDWHQAHLELSDRNTFRFAPNIFCFGSGSALLADIEKIASTKILEKPDSAAYWLDLSVGDSVVIHSLIYQFFIGILRHRLNAQAIATRVFEIPSDVPGIISSEEIDHLEFRNGLGAFPLYIVCDEGALDNETAEWINNSVSGFLTALRGNPILDEKVWLRLVAFSGEVADLTPLTKFSTLNHVPGFVPSASSSSSYATLFHALKSMIERDSRQLRVHGYALLRPEVFFVSAGRPNSEDWRTRFAQLVEIGFKYRPNITSFGVAGADPAVLTEVSTTIAAGGSKKKGFVLLADQGIDPSLALKEIMIQNRWSPNDYVCDDPLFNGGWSYIAPRKTPNNQPTMTVPDLDDLPLRIDCIIDFLE